MIPVVMFQDMPKVFAFVPGLWALVNNAGVMPLGDVEFTSVETYKKVADVNLFGTIRMTKACLPLIRAGKGGSTE